MNTSPELEQEHRAVNRVEATGLLSSKSEAG
jgi:hypothetical protein